MVAFEKDQQPVFVYIDTLTGQVFTPDPVFLADQTGDWFSPIFTPDGVVFIVKRERAFDIICYSFSKEEDV